MPGEPLPERIFTHHLSTAAGVRPRLSSLRSPPTPICIVLVPGSKHRIEFRVGQPTPQHAVVRGANPVIEHLAIPAWRRTAQGDFPIGMKTGNCLAPGLGSGVELRPVVERKTGLPV